MGNNVLTAKQENFCQHVVQGDTYADSYRKSYNAEKMSINTIYVKASQLMDQDKIRVRVSELRESTIKRNEITIDKVLEQLANWLLFDPIDLMDDSGCVKDLRHMDKKSRMSLSDIKVQETYGSIGDDKGKTGEIKTIKFVDKRATADMFMKKFGQYINEQDNSLANNLDAIREIVNAVKKE